MRKVLILGSTGSIGTQALEVIAQHPDRFDVVGLSALSNTALLSHQAQQFGVPADHLAVGSIEAAALVDRDVDQHRARLHRAEHLASQQLGRGGARDQHRADHQIR